MRIMATSLLFNYIIINIYLSVNDTKCKLDGSEVLYVIIAELDLYKLL